MKKLFFLIACLFVSSALWGRPQHASCLVVPIQRNNIPAAITTHILSVTADTLTELTVTVCEEDLPYFFNNQLLTEPGTYWESLQALNGSDSIVRLNLFVKCCQAATNSPNFADVCTEAPLLCADYFNTTLFNLDNSTADIPGNLAAQFCFPIDHSRWLRFSACADSVSLELTVQSCSGSNPAQEGVEIAMFTSSNCLDFSRIGNCYQTVLSQTQTLQFDGLSPGMEYYLFADGISSEGCEFSLKALAGINSGIPDSLSSTGSATDGMISGDKDVCPGETVVYTLTPPTCKMTFPVFDCSPPDGACGFCGTVLALDSVTYLWHIPDCARFLGDSTGLTVEVIYDQCVFFTDTVVVQQIWAEMIPVYSDTFFVQKDTLVFCDCFPGGLTCGIIPPCDVRIHFNVEDIFLTIPCAGPPPEFMGTPYPTPGIFTQFDVPNCLFIVIHVDKEPGPPLTVTPPFSFITCNYIPALHASSTAQITWITPFGFPVNGPDMYAFEPGMYTAIATDPNGCVSVASAMVWMNLFIPDAYAGPDQVLCAEEAPVQLHAIAGGSNILYYWSNGATGPNPIVNQAFGTVTYSLTVTDATNGCTNTDKVAVTVKQPIVTNLSPLTLCPGECFSLGGEMFCPTPINAPVQVVLTSYTGCDSIITQPFVFHAPDTLQLGQVAMLNCALSSVDYQGVTYIQPGTYTVQMDPCTFEQFSIGQDIQSPPPTMLSPIALCPGECFTFNGQTICPLAGDAPPSLLLAAVNGCDSVITQPFVFHAPDTLQLGQVAMLNCALSSVDYQGVTYIQPGTYTVQMDPCNFEQFSIGQDIQSPPPTVLSPIALCPGECFTFNGQTICPLAGDAAPSMLLAAVNGCDSVVTQPFVFHAPDTLQLGQVAMLNCAVSSVDYQGVTYTQPGTYTVQTDPCTFNQFSIAQNIQSPPPTMLSPIALCPGECFSFNGQTICPLAGDAAPSMLLAAVNGCDSVITQPFVFHAPDTLQLGQVAMLDCAVSSVDYQGVTYIQPGTYTVQMDPCNFEQFSIGQDIQSPPPTMLLPIALCPGECFSFNGQTICPLAGDAAPSMLLAAVNGCDSVITQPFVFHAPDTLQLGQVATLNCALSSVDYQGVTYIQPGTYTVQMDPCTFEQFSIGQDIQSPPPTVLLPIALCPGECFTFNGQTICPLAGDAAPSMLLAAVNGCDSVITQPFVFHAPDTLQLGQVATLNCALSSVDYQGVTYIQPGTYTVQMDPCTFEQFSIGQDIQSPPPTMLSPIALCPGECFTFNGQTICPLAGDAAPSMLLAAVNGCDSVIQQPFQLNAPDTISMGTVGTLTCKDTAIMMAGITYTQPGDYLKQLDPCTYERFIIAKSPDKCHDVYVPNIIQAGSDGDNAWFTLYTNEGSGIQVNYLRIFDRWGNELFLNTQFSPNVPELGWNGTFRGRPCQPAVYVFVYEVRLPNGERQMKSGDITVIR